MTDELGGIVTLKLTTTEMCAEFNKSEVYIGSKCECGANNYTVIDSLGLQRCVNCYKVGVKETGLVKVHGI